MYINAGELDTRLEVLQLAEKGPRQWEWTAARRPWGKVTLDTKRRNLFSTSGLGARGATILLRRQPLTLHHALRWGEQHLLITAIVPQGRGYLEVSAALVELTQCEDRYTGSKFPAVVTEKYHQHDQLEPQAVNVAQHVLVTPKAIELTPGRLVEVGGVSWPIQTAQLLDPYKNEYVIERTVDL